MSKLVRIIVLIKYFTVENYGSIRDENILEFNANLGKGSYLPAHPTIGFAGANGSGKTTILQSLSFVLWFMRHSFLKLEEGEEIPCVPFLTLPDSPTKFHLIFAKRNADQKFIDYEYELTIDRTHVIVEKLYYYPERRRKLVYNRNKNKVRFGKEIESIVIKDLRPNCSLVSFATQFDSQKIALDCKNYQVSSNLFSTQESRVLFEHPAVLQKSLLKVFSKYEYETLKKKVIDSIRIADVGIENVITQKEVIKFVHKLDDMAEGFDFDLESAGTLQFLRLLIPISDALDNGNVFILDEIELKLHPSLVAYLIGLFQNPQENPKGTQLIFSFHNSYFMEILQPEQLWFAEKNDQGQTQLFSAAAFTDIKDLYQKDLELLYRAGRFGAKPREL